MFDSGIGLESPSPLYLLPKNILCSAFVCGFLLFTLKIAQLCFSTSLQACFYDLTEFDFLINKYLSCAALVCGGPQWFLSKVTSYNLFFFFKSMSASVVQIWFCSTPLPSIRYNLGPISACEGGQKPKVDGS